ncbi:MAG: disulfide bond formation protein B [Hyphomicrobiaceae bacterium]|nr:disulfide bond formation protein B [Hyphomicrobiaceae bacterium]
MALSSMEASRGTSSYQIGALVLFVAVAAILTALGFEHIGGYQPCPLCLQQRWAYYAGIPALFAALVLVASQRPKAAAVLFFLVALAFLANTGLGIYHSGVEWKFWEGPAGCSSTQALPGSVGDLMSGLSQGGHIARCDDSAWRFLGLSFAGWNALISLALFAGALKAASSAAMTRDSAR